jgi:hypothetical protein
MCSINHDKKAIFIHIPKTGGTYIRENLEKYYGFKFHVIKRPDHNKFCNTHLYNKSDKYKEFVANREHGILKYAKTSNYINRMINMDKNKWDSYKIFCFVRNPYDRLISGWNYLNTKHLINVSFEDYIYQKDIVSDFEYIHTFMSQYNNMIDENNIFVIDLLGKFENIENDFSKILLNIGFREDEIIHDKNKKNDFSHNSYINIINTQFLLDTINNICNEDFEKFHYKKVIDFNDFNDFNEDNLSLSQQLPPIEIKKYIKLSGDLKNYGLIDFNYYNTLLIFEELRIFNDNFDLIKNELFNNIEIMQDWLLKDKEDKFYSKHTIIPIYGYNRWSKYAIHFPITVSLINRIKDIITCCFLKLSKNTRLDKHYGYNPSSNYILRNHLGLKIPDNCGMWVNGEIKYHKEREWITFDDSKLHTAFNNSNEERYILLIDLKRPDYIKIGNSLRTDNYDELISEFINENI